MGCPPPRDGLPTYNSSRGATEICTRVSGVRVHRRNVRCVGGRALDLGVARGAGDTRATQRAVPETNISSTVSAGWRRAVW
jgi:hypothetical protein